MIVEDARVLLGQIETVITMLTSVANEATAAEAYWQEHGDGSVPTIWTAAQKQAFADILDHTKLRREQLQNKKLV